MVQKKPKKVLITGANGFIGNRLMQHYKDHSIPVVGVDLTGNGKDIFGYGALFKTFLAI